MTAIWSEFHNPRDPYVTHVPFLAHYIAKWLRETETGDVAEFGCGNGSTGLMRKMLEGTGRRLVSYDNSEEWIAQMKRRFPENEMHSYVLVKDWKEAIEAIPQDQYSLVFIDQSPWEARYWTLLRLKDHARYVFVHDVDFYAGTGMFGRVISRHRFDFSDVFRNYQVYYPEHPWPGESGPPTLVGTNLDGVGMDPIESIATRP